MYRLPCVALVSATTLWSIINCQNATSETSVSMASVSLSDILLAALNKSNVVIYLVQGNLYLNQTVNSQGLNMDLMPNSTVGFGFGPTYGPQIGDSYGPTIGSSYGNSFGATFGSSIGSSFGPTYGPSIGPGLGPTFGPSIGPAYGPTYGPSYGSSYGPQYSVAALPPGLPTPSLGTPAAPASSVTKSSTTTTVKGTI